MAGRGGRGRGGRGGRGGRTGGHDLLRDTAEDLGIDSRSIGFESAPPPLYPPTMELPGPMQMTVEDFWRVQKQREHIQRLQESPYYLQQNSIVTDIERYNSPRGGDARGRQGQLRKCLIISSGDAEVFIPQDLLGGKTVVGGAAKSRPLEALAGKTLSRLAEKEARVGTGQEGAAETKEKDEEEEGKDNDGSDLELEEEDDNDDHGDYQRDHYDSANDSDNEDGGGPVF